MTRLWLGADPGVTGAFAYIDRDTRAIIALYDMPVFKIAKSGGGARTEIDIAIIERVGPRPGEGGVGGFSFGLTYGIIRGVITAHKIPYSLAHPAKWKREMSCPADKDMARQRAGQLLPHETGRWPLVKHHGRAEAALLALWGLRSMGGPEMARAG